MGSRASFARALQASSSTSTLPKPQVIGAWVDLTCTFERQTVRNQQTKQNRCSIADAPGTRATARGQLQFEFVTLWILIASTNSFLGSHRVSHPAALSSDAFQSVNFPASRTERPGTHTRHSHTTDTRKRLVLYVHCTCVSHALFFVLGDGK